MNDNDALEIINKNKDLILGKDEGFNTKVSLKHYYKPASIRHGVRSVNLTHDDRYLIITFMSRHGFIRVIDLEKLALLPVNYPGHTDSVRMASVSKDDKYFYTASWDGTYRRFDLLTGISSNILGLTGRSPSCFLDADDKHLLTGSYDSDLSISMNNTGRRFDLQTNEVVTFYRHFKPRKDPECIDIACDRHHSYSGSDDGMGLKFDLQSGEIVLTFFECDANIRKIAVSDHFFAASATDGVIRVHDKKTGEKVGYFFHNNNESMDVRISNDETKLFSGSMDGSIKCFSLVTGEELYHKKIHDHWIWSLYLTRNNSILVSGSADGSVAFISAETGQLLARLYCFPVENEFLFECPPDKAFENGFFYTSNKDFIEVVQNDMESGIKRVLDLKDPERISYIDRLNLKNMVITRLTNNRQYTAITDKYLSDRKLLDQARDIKLPKGLKS